MNKYDKIQQLKDEIAKLENELEQEMVKECSYVPQVGEVALFSDGLADDGFLPKFYAGESKGHLSNRYATVSILRDIADSDEYYNYRYCRRLIQPEEHAPDLIADEHVVEKKDSDFNGEDIEQKHTFKKGDLVEVRDRDDQDWRIAFFIETTKVGYFITTECGETIGAELQEEYTLQWKQCRPYTPQTQKVKPKQDDWCIGFSSTKGGMPTEYSSLRYLLEHDYAHIMDIEDFKRHALTREDFTNNQS